MLTELLGLSAALVAVATLVLLVAGRRPLPGYPLRAALLVVLVFVVAIAGGSVMTLAWGLLFKLMPPADRGAISGLATTTKGLGLLVGPLVAGAAIELLRGPLAETEGYQALWPVLGAPILIVLPFVAMLARAEERIGQANGAAG